MSINWLVSLTVQAFVLSMTVTSTLWSQEPEFMPSVPLPADAALLKNKTTREYLAFSYPVTKEMIESKVPVYANVTLKDTSGVTVYRLDKNGKSTKLSNFKVSANEPKTQQVGNWSEVREPGSYFLILMADSLPINQILISSQLLSTNNPLDVVIKSLGANPDKGDKFQVKYVLGKNSHVALRVLDEKLNEVKQLDRGPKVRDQEYTTSWDATNNKPKPGGDSRMYIIHLSAKPPKGESVPMQVTVHVE